MINERILSEKFSIIWKQHFPMLTSNFMKVLNGTQTIPINDYTVNAHEGIRYDFVAEFSFSLAQKVLSQNLDIEYYISDETELKNLTIHTASNLGYISTNKNENLTLSVIEIAESKSICRNIIHFINSVQENSYHFNPKLKGYGIISDLIADISIDDTLYEIKTVTRNFRSSDLKQLFIYLALEQVTGKKNWRYGGLYNPREGIYYKFNINDLIYNLSGGKSANETFENLLNSLTRDIEIDSRF